MFGNRKQTEATVQILKGGMERHEERLSSLESTVTELARSLEAELARLRSLTDEIDHRIDRGNKIWRQVRATERRLEELAGIEEGDEDPDLFDGHEEGGRQEGVRGMLPDMGSHPVDDPITVARKALAAAHAARIFL